MAAIEQTLREALAAEADLLYPLPESVRPIAGSGLRRTVWRPGTIAAGLVLLVVGVAVLLSTSSGFQQSSDDGGLALLRFEAIAGPDAASRSDSVIYPLSIGPEPARVPAGVVVQPLRAPGEDDVDRFKSMIDDLLDIYAEADRASPVMLAGVNELSGAVGISWIALAVEVGRLPEYCTGALADNGATVRCDALSPEIEGSGGLSDESLTTIGFHSYSDDSGFELPITIGSGVLPLSTSYAILTGPGGDRWLQYPIAGSVLFAVDTRDPEGTYGLIAYDAEGGQLAVGSYEVARPQVGADIRSGPYTCEPPLREPMRWVLYDAFDQANIVRPSNWGDGLDESHAGTMPTSEQLADATDLDCSWELNGQDGLFQTSSLSFVWQDDLHLGVIRTEFDPGTMPDAELQIDIPEVGIVAGSWVSDTVFAGVAGSGDLVVLFKSVGVEYPNRG